MAALLNGSVGDEVNAMCQGTAVVQQPLNYSNVQHLHDASTHVITVRHAVGQTDSVSGAIHHDVGNQFPVDEYIPLSVTGLRQKQTDTDSPVLEARWRHYRKGHAGNLSQ
jgi:hypothetical protein